MSSILVVDDDPFIRKLIVTTLADVGDFSLVEAGDGQRALELARELGPRMVFLDVEMPKLDGIEACRRIKADPATAETTVVMLTASATPSDEERAREAGADLFMRKPFSPLDLLRLVEGASVDSALEPRRALRGYLGLGSNVGDRLEHLSVARRRFESGALDGVRLVGVSSVYETGPHGEGMEGQRDYLNACLEIDTTLTPEQLVGACKSLEIELGRVPSSAPNEPRPIDIDVLALEGVDHDSDGVRVPHPRIAERRFVLEPLVELAPDFVLPGGSTPGEALRAVAGQRVQIFSRGW